MSNPLFQISIQVRPKEALDSKQLRKLEENAGTLLVGAAAEAGIPLILEPGPVHVTSHIHDAANNPVCAGCVVLAQDGRA